MEPNPRPGRQQQGQVRLTDEDLPLPSETASEGEALEPDFVDEPLETDPTVVVEEGDVYVPPVDPVIAVNDQAEVEVLGGISPDAMDPPTEPERGVEGASDDTIAEAVRDELRRDAATTDLTISVLVRDGVAHLRGGVASLEDAENAEAVTSRVAGVREVEEDLEIAGL